ncbi:MAG: GGDEF domain-containing protein [Rhodanobacteraceae bacterium]|nr:MAG: GGDEF domain-containing protein [Rhodanobacteraceae bacterium]
MNSQSVATPSIDSFKRGMVLVIIVLALLSTIAGWIAMGARGMMTPALGRVQMITTLLLLALLITAWWKLLPQRAIELGCLLVAFVVCAVCMALAMYSPRYGAGLHLQPLYLWIPVIYVFAFTLTDHKTGLILSLAMLLLFFGISLPYLMRGRAATYGNLTLQLHFVSAVLIAALYFFSSYQHRLGQAQRTLEQLAYLSNTDALTGLSNRRHMAAIIAGELARCGDGRGGFAIMLFDIDHFKAINDQLGHGGGDKVLAALAARAGKLFRDGDSLGRWGGDEFVAIARGLDAAAAERMAETLREGIATEPLFGRCRATISCGVTLARAGDSLDGLLQRVDVALYAAKRAGRDRVEGIILKAS